MEKAVHLRTALDMGKEFSPRTFCHMPTTTPWPERFTIFYRVTEYPDKVTCKRCLKKMLNRKGK